MSATPAAPAQASVHPPWVVRQVMALAAWSVAYVCCRAHYAVGGQVDMIGESVSAAQFRAINAAGAIVVIHPVGRHLAHRPFMSWLVSVRAIVPNAGLRLGSYQRDRL